MRRNERERAGSSDLVLETVRGNATALLGLARRYSICADDAHDAYQRGIEIFLRRVDTVEPETALAWLRTVVKHEAMAVRRSRLQLVGADEAELDRHQASNQASPEEQIASFDRLTASAEALQRLKPHEVRALWLKAQGLSYQEIGEVTGWSYTKVNRCLTEGRRAFLERYHQIESGEECERWAPVLSAMADGEATPEQLLEVRPHLRNCPACRATIRAFHTTTDDFTAVLPVPVVMGAAAGAGQAGSTIAERVGEITSGFRGVLTTMRDAVTGLLSRTPGGSEAAGAALAGGGGTVAAGGAKLAALCVSVTVAAGGTYCLDSTVLDKPRRDRAPNSLQDRRVAANDRLRAKERTTDRRQRRANTSALFRERIEAEARRRAAVREGVRERTTSNQTTPSQASQPTPTTTPQKPRDDGLGFETGSAAGPAQAQPSQTPEPSGGGEFGGGGFEK